MIKKTNIKSKPISLVKKYTDHEIEFCKVNYTTIDLEKILYDFETQLSNIEPINEIQFLLNWASTKETAISQYWVRD